MIVISDRTQIITTICNSLEKLIEVLKISEWENNIISCLEDKVFEVGIRNIE
ncbi:hypothetical protein [Caloranaerobacter sp. DY30410]|uniref:hypothetical protein n=1 Tax=Caloranaerobacter sp. DY30410 TaxID=3238305 RepID=UPI003D073CC8